MPPTTSSAPPHAREQSRLAAPASVRTPAQSLWRLREYLRPYYFRLFIMITAAVIAVSAEIVIPLLTKSVIDSVVVRGIRAELVPLGIAAMALGTFQAGL